MTPVERLQLELDCRSLVLRTIECMDAGDADRLAALFTEDAVLVRPSGEPLTGRAAIRASYALRKPERITRHVLANTLVEIQGPQRVRAASYVVLWAGESGSPPGPLGRAALQQAVGEFHDDLYLVNGVWLVGRREARFILHAGA